MRPITDVSRVPALRYGERVSWFNVSSPSRRESSASRHGSVIRVIATLLTSVLFLLHAGAARAEIQYVYDEASRLVQVVDAAGKAAHYQYDAAGNIVAVHRYAASDLAITEFMPESGPVGTTVAIYGVGFSPTPADNLVTFNGTAAVVSAASSIKLVTQVPGAASTGLISVTVGSRTATSSKSFTVTTDAPNAPPIITSFSPTIGPVGTTVTIDGEHFEASVANNIVKFNLSRASPASSTATEIISAVPSGATSGPIHVRTPYGAATSSGDFFVPPAGYTPAQVSLATRIAVDGAPLAISTGSAGKIAMVLFDGIQGQGLGLGMSPVTFAPAGGSASVRIIRRSGHKSSLRASAPLPASIYRCCRIAGPIPWSFSRRQPPRSVPRCRSQVI